MIIQKHKSVAVKFLENISVQFSSVQSLSCVWHFATPWTAACQASLFITHVHKVGDAIQPSHPLSSPSPPAFNLFQIMVFSKEKGAKSSGQCIGVSASASVHPVNIQHWSHLGLTGWFSLLSKELSRVFNTTVQKHQFFSAQLSLWSNFHIHTWLPENP